MNSPTYHIELTWSRSHRLTSYAAVEFFRAVAFNVQFFDAITEFLSFIY